MSWRPPRPGRLIASLAAFVALSLLLTAVVFASVLNVDTGSTRTYHAIFSDASGLRQGAYVKIAGINVGTVKDVSLYADTGVRVTFSVRSDRSISDTTHAEIRYANLIGTRYVALTRPLEADAGQTLRDGATIPEQNTKPAIDLTAVFNGFQPLFDALSPGEINQLTGSIINVFQGQSSQVADLVEQIGTITSHLADRKQVIESLVTNLTGVVTQVDSQGKALGELIGNFDATVTNVAGQRELLARTIAAMARFTTNAADLTRQSSSAIDGDIKGIGIAARTLVKNRKAISELLRDAPGALAAIDATMDSGSYLKVYLCNLELRATGRLNLSLVPGLSAPQPPNSVELPSGVVGSPANRSGVCR